MSDALLILNAGSSSLKFSVFRDSDPPELLLRGQLESLLTEPRFVARDATGHVLDEHAWPAGSTLGHAGAIEFLFDWGQRGRLSESRLVAAGHRVVHGGTKFTQPARVDDGVLADLESLVPLAPLHQPHNLAAIRAVASHAPTLPQVACFDTSFHRTQPAVAQQFAIPRELTASGIQRYGFHGLSYEYIASRLPQVDPNAATGRTIVAHLGNGVSLCALRGGSSVATTMGFTPLDGLPMGTRCGAIDPGVLLHLMNHHSLDARALERLLTHESGLLGVSGISSDMRTLLERESTDARAAEAIELFVYRIAREIGSLAAALGGLDALIFTGGIGEHAPSIRARVCRAANWLGLDFDEAGNEQSGPRISRSTSRISAWVIPTNEELMIAQHTQHLLKSRQP
ncbi:MAG: acetate/propionate family kinase [Planctomycetaceae bacterium]|nr:acetate/propionate family kinase [Planctomycetaceae bacterium]